MGFRRLVLPLLGCLMVAGVASFQSIPSAQAECRSAFSQPSDDPAGGKSPILRMIQGREVLKEVDLGSFMDPDSVSDTLVQMLYALNNRLPDPESPSDDVVKSAQTAFDLALRRFKAQVDFAQPIAELFQKALARLQATPGKSWNYKLERRKAEGAGSLTFENPNKDLQVRLEMTPSKLHVAVRRTIAGDASFELIRPVLPLELSVTTRLFFETILREADTPNQSFMTQLEIFYQLVRQLGEDLLRTEVEALSTQSRRIQNLMETLRKESPSHWLGKNGLDELERLLHTTLEGSDG